MPIGVYDRTKHTRACEYCGEALTFTTNRWKDHISRHIRKGDQKKAQAVVVNPTPTDLSCPECKAAGVERTFKNVTLRNRHRSREHKVRGPNYHLNQKYYKKRAKAGSIVHVKRGGLNGTNGASQAQIVDEAIHAQDQDRIEHFAAGYTTRTLEVLAASVNQPPALLTARVLSILQVGNNPVRKELRR